VLVGWLVKRVSRNGVLRAAKISKNATNEIEDEACSCENNDKRIGKARHKAASASQSVERMTIALEFEGCFIVGIELQRVYRRSDNAKKLIGKAKARALIFLFFSFHHLCLPKTRFFSFSLRSRSFLLGMGWVSLLSRRPFTEASR
jgi:hypothetical protein